MMTSKKLSLYRTKHKIRHYLEISSEANALEIVTRYSGSGTAYILGNGSNTFFQNFNVRSVILKNKLPKSIQKTDEDRYYITSSTLVSEVLKFCYKHELDSFYFLASVPAEIGGAIAMNAGEGPGVLDASIFNFIEKVRYIRDSDIHESPPSELEVGYRRTMFTGHTPMFILGAYFRFPKVDEFAEQPIRHRVEWAKKHQDLSKPNCGSVFKTANPKILYRFRGLRLFGASFSKKTYNWITNESPNPLGIRLLILLVIITHRILFQKCETEIIRVK